MKSAIISLGSNTGDRKGMLQQAVERLAFVCKILQVSDVYETRTEKGGRHDPFLNACVEIETDMTSYQLLEFLGETQKQLSGANSEEKLLHTSIDIDLVSVDAEVVRTPQLTLPHPDAYRQAYIMIPLAQIKPDWEHPILKKKASELAQEVYWLGWGTFFAQGKSLLDF